MSNEKLKELANSKGYAFGKIKNGYDFWTGKGENFKKSELIGSRSEFISFVKSL